MSEIKSSKISKNFDLKKFNNEFVFKKEQSQIQNRIKSKEKIDRLTQMANIQKKSLYNFSIAEITIGIKDTWFGILDDILSQKFEIKTLTKNDRLFFIGLTIIFISAILYIYNFFLDEKKIEDVKPQIIEKHYIYNNDVEKDKIDNNNDVEKDKIDNNKTS
jgi:hypothetical protein